MRYVATVLAYSLFLAIGAAGLILCGAAFGVEDLFPVNLLFLAVALAGEGWGTVRIEQAVRAMRPATTGTRVMFAGLPFLFSSVLGSTGLWWLARASGQPFAAGAVLVAVFCSSGFLAGGFAAVRLSRTSATG